MEDNAGNYGPPIDSQGLGMRLVDQRIKNVYGSEFGLTVEYDPQQKTLVQVKLPTEKELANDPCINH